MVSRGVYPRRPPKLRLGLTAPATATPAVVDGKRGVPVRRRSATAAFVSRSDGSGTVLPVEAVHRGLDGIGVVVMRESVGEVVSGLGEAVDRDVLGHLEVDRSGHPSGVLGAAVSPMSYLVLLWSTDLVPSRTRRLSEADRNKNLAVAARRRGRATSRRPSARPLLGWDTNWDTNAATRGPTDAYGARQTGRSAAPTRPRVRARNRR